MPPSACFIERVAALVPVVGELGRDLRRRARASTPSCPSLPSSRTPSRACRGCDGSSGSSWIACSYFLIAPSTLTLTDLVAFVREVDGLDVVAAAAASRTRRPRAAVTRNVREASRVSSRASLVSIESASCGHRREPALRALLEAGHRHDAGTPAPTSGAHVRAGREHSDSAATSIRRDRASTDRSDSSRREALRTPGSGLRLGLRALGRACHEIVAAPSRHARVRETTRRCRPLTNATGVRPLTLREPRGAIAASERESARAKRVSGPTPASAERRSLEPRRPRPAGVARSGLSAGREHDRVDDRDDAAFGLREATGRRRRGPRS